MTQSSCRGPYEVLIRYDESVINEGASLFWRKKMRVLFSLIVAYVLATTALIYLGALEVRFGGFFATIGLVLALIMYAGFRSVRSRSMAIFREMDNKVTVWTFAESALSTRNDIGATEIKWKLLSGLVKSDKVWLLIYKNGSYSVLPVTDVELPIRDFIEDRVVVHGGKIIT
jgi:hypothetical protein